MIFSFETLCNKIKSISENKITYVVYGSYFGNTFLFLFLTFFLIELFMYFHLSFFFLLFVLLLFIFFVSFRRMGLGMGENHFIYIPFYRIRFKEKEVYEFSFEQIKYLNVKHFFSISFVTISFLDVNGKFKKIHLYYNSFVIGLSVKEQKTNAYAISKKLEEIQKVLDRGDF